DGCTGLRHTSVRFESDLEAGCCCVLLEVGAHRQGLVDPDTGAQEDCRRMDRARTQNYLASVNLLAGGRSQPSGASPVEQDAVDEHIATDVQVRPSSGRLEVGVVGR